MVKRFRFRIVRSRAWARIRERALRADCLQAGVRLRPGRARRQLADQVAVALRRLPAPLPPGLAHRLQQIPDHEIACGHVARLYPSWSQRTQGKDKAVLRHLATCSRCRALFGGLELAFTKPQQPLPTALAQRLRAIARQPARVLPWWVRDQRFAWVASCLFTAFLLLPAASAPDRVRHHADLARNRVSVWVDRQQAEGAQRLAQWSADVASGFTHGREKLDLHRRSYTRLFGATVELLSDLEFPNELPHTIQKTFRKLFDRGQHHE
jgi:hypothetical protein